MTSVLPSDGTYDLVKSPPGPSLTSASRVLDIAACLDCQDATPHQGNTQFPKWCAPRTLPEWFISPTRPRRALCRSESQDLYIRVSVWDTIPNQLPHGKSLFGKITVFSFGFRTMSCAGSESAFLVTVQETLRPMRSRFHPILIALVLGCLVNILLAWVIVLVARPGESAYPTSFYYSDIQFKGFIEVEDLGIDVFALIDDPYSEAGFSYRDANRGWEVRGTSLVSDRMGPVTKRPVTGFMGGKGIQSSRSRSLVDFYVVSVGWPALAFRSLHDNQYSLTEERVRWSRRVVLGEDGYSGDYRSSASSVVPVQIPWHLRPLVLDSSRGSGELPKRWFPLGPIPLGFTINTIIYATSFWIIGALFSRLRAILRCKRGLCPGCAYDTRGLDRCPECGKPI